MEDAASVALAPETTKAYRGILLGGAVAGALDISYAIIASAILGGRNPVWVLQSVASGLLGSSAFDGGLPVAALGLALHFFIATTATAVYFVASRKLGFMVRQAIVCGLIYGILVYLFMNFVVIPLSACPFKPTYPLPVVPIVRGLIGHMLLVGLPMSLSVRIYSK